MGEIKRYEGSCHCGKVAYETKADLGSVKECNCSLCSRKGALMTFVAADAFTLKSGEGSLSDYQFGKRHIHHLFCSTCGIHTHGMAVGSDGNPMYMLNVRCLADVEPWALPNVQHVDGRSL